MTKREKILTDLVRAYQNGHSPTREEFVKRSGFTRRDIDKEFGNFAKLKLEARNFIELSLKELIDKPEVPRKAPEKPLESLENQKTITVEGNNIKSLEDLVAYCSIDLAEWEATKFSVSVWDNKSSAKAEFKRRVEEKAIEQMLENFISEAEKHAPKKFKYSRPKEDGKLFILNIQDTHLGKRAESEETGWGDYNLEIAKNAYTNAVQQLMDFAPVEEIGTVMLIVGSDFIHFESEAVVSTALTRLESDSSWYTVYNEGCKLITDTVSSLAERFKVEVIVVTGNHARLTEYALGSYVKAFFRNHENVNVDNTPLSRKYFGFKKNLIGMVHGDKIKISDLPLVMMRENQATVSNYEQFCWLSGHWHQDKLLDIKGVRVLVCPALCAPDKFHSSNNYVGNIQSAQGLLFAEWGLQQIIYSKSPLPKVREEV
jgi:hypothetical protein